MANELQGISSYCGESNLPGLRTLLYLPVSWLDTDEYEEYLTSANNFQKAISPSLGGAEWLTMPYLPKGDGWRERQRKTSQGSEWEQDISGVMPKLRPEVTGELALMVSERFLVRLTDKNGKPWLVGREWEPLEFTYSADSGSTDGGLNAYSFQFSGVTTKAAFGYTPVF